jgi:GR25 family glycosyltransferase involved in LPS biosynthesis
VETQAIALDGLPVYVMHGGRNPERRAVLEPELERQAIDATWLTDVNYRDLTREVTDRYYAARPRLWQWRALATFSTPYRKLRRTEIANGLSHIEVWRKIVAGGRGWTLVLEDDALLDPEFAERFDEYFASLPGDADMVFIGSCCGLRIAEVEEGRHFYRKGRPASKCVDSYLVTPSAASALLSTVVPFVLPIDWELNYHLALHDLVVYWVEPPLVRQGSETGAYASEVMPRRRSPAYWRARYLPGGR